jgi:hypothetical protein
MECHHVRQLLAFWRRPVDGLDAEEQAALRHHLDQCPECAALARDERRADGALGPPLRDIAVPAGLKERLLQHLASQRRPIPAWIKGAAAAVFLAAAGGAGYLAWSVRPLLNSAEIVQLWEAKSAKSADDVEAWFQSHGVTMQAPRQFNYKDYFRSCDMVEFMGRRVPLLLFNHPDRSAWAQVYVLSSDQFRLHELAEGERLPTQNALISRPDADTVYLIFHSGDRDLRSLCMLPQVAFAQ